MVLMSVKIMVKNTLIAIIGNGLEETITMKNRILMEAMIKKG
jgi:hypothetical protein